MYATKIREKKFTEMGLISARLYVSGSAIPGTITVIFRGPLNPSTFVSCKYKFKNFYGRRQLLNFGSESKVVENGALMGSLPKRFLEWTVGAHERS